MADCVHDHRCRCRDRPRMDGKSSQLFQGCLRTLEGLTVGSVKTCKFADFDKARTGLLVRAVFPNEKKKGGELIV